MSRTIGLSILANGDGEYEYFSLSPPDGGGNACVKEGAVGELDNDFRAALDKYLKEGGTATTNTAAKIPTTIPTTIPATNTAAKIPTTIPTATNPAANSQSQQPPQQNTPVKINKINEISNQVTDDIKKFMEEDKLKDIKDIENIKEEQIKSIKNIYTPTTTFTGFFNKKSDLDNAYENAISNINKSVKDYKKYREKQIQQKDRENVEEMFSLKKKIQAGKQTRRHKNPQNHKRTVRKNK